MKKLALLLLLSVFQFSLPAQSTVQNIKGRILDKDTKQPLIGATVLVTSLDSRPGTVTDLDGNFELTGIPTGRHRLEFSYIGYEAYILDDAIVNSAKELVLDIELVEGSITTGEVIVSARSYGNEPLNELAMVSTRSFSAEETQRYSASANDPSRMAVSFPGVQSSRDNRNDIVIRGNAGFGMLWRVEGIDIPNPNHFLRRGSSGGGITVFSVGLLSNSDFSTGAFPAEYGNALSGIFDIKFRNGNTEKREYTFRAGMLGLEVATEGPIKKGQSSYLVNYRYSTLGILDAFDIRLVDERESNRFQDLSFKLNFNSADNRHITSVWGISGISREFFEAVEGIENWRTYDDYLTRTFNTQMGAIGINHNFLIDDKSYLRTSLAIMGQHILYQNDTLNRNLNATMIRDEQYTSNRLVLSSTYNRKLSPKLTLKAGLIGKGIQYDFFYSSKLPPGNPPAFIDQNDRTWQLQAFANLRLRPHPRWTVNFGLHSLYLGLNETSNLEPRIGLNYQLSESAELSLAYGLHSRTVPLPNYFIREYSGNNFTLPNLDLDLIKAHHLVLAYRQLLGNGMRLQLEAYYQSLYDVPVSADPNSTISLLNHADGFFITRLVSEGTGTNTGLDLTLERSFLNGTFFILAGSLFNSTYEPLNGQTYDTRYNSGIAASLMGGKEWALSDNATLQTGLRVVYGGGQRLTPILSPERDPRDPDNPILDESRPYTLPVGDFFRPDIRIAYRRDNPGNAWYIALDVQNVIGRNNEDPLDYTYDPDLEDWIFRSQSSIVPVLSFQIDF
ncbi:TonB-dependent receptor [Flavilitoribacter nigricans]|uniref:TonB-dependent receptor n=1 Tax=Flavilitoribacter nigricans (strain ATCC 23147 / DSM 23189 / NBRC 102662 / NCIMB 1420 / SS-2) TaxID=1122177 RepID=A0A2D0NHB9_FLAN2|nr:TonB-dependent receptor [Flavilitoribacter nigricans]PHN07894.1 TonB-dependent receptor [Flavilitoribacter nigricans DSM 23189 = NBRC 102662]